MGSDETLHHSDRARSRQLAGRRLFCLAGLGRGGARHGGEIHLDRYVSYCLTGREEELIVDAVEEVDVICHRKPVMLQ